MKISTYSSAWKQKNANPSFKKSDTQLIQNYRSISFLSLSGKIFEKIILENLYSYLKEHLLITKHQYGFKHNGSTENKLVFLINKILDNKKSTEAWTVFLDTSKAFDKV